MTLSNFERLLNLADEVFAVKNDPSQLDIDPHVLERLKQIHPATISEYTDLNEPVAWVLVIPTTLGLMNRFLKAEITEKELFELTPVNTTYETLYLCSALVLEEYRQQGITKQLAILAIEEIRITHPLKAVFVWAFSPEGDLAAEKIASLVKLPLLKRDK